MFPAPSVAVYVTSVVPTGKTKVSHVLVGLPGIGHGTDGTPVRTIETAEHESVAVATPNSSSISAEHVPVVVLTSAGIVSTGGVVSPLAVIVMVCVHDALPIALVAVQVIVVTPTGYGSVRPR